MKFTESTLKKMLSKRYEASTIDERIAMDLLNFIRTIHLNKQDFYSASFDSQYFGNIEMTFKKAANCLIGHCKVYIKEEQRGIEYFFTENGFEQVQDVLKG